MLATYNFVSSGELVQLPITCCVYLKRNCWAFTDMPSPYFLSMITSNLEIILL